MYAAQLTTRQSREFAVAAAKTITQDDGSTDVIVESALFSASADRAFASRVLDTKDDNCARAARREVE